MHVRTMKFHEQEIIQFLHTINYTFLRMLAIIVKQVYSLYSTFQTQTSKHFKAKEMHSNELQSKRL